MNHNFISLVLLLPSRQITSLAGDVVGCLGAVITAFPHKSYNIDNATTTLFLNSCNTLQLCTKGKPLFKRISREIHFTRFVMKTLVLKTNKCLSTEITDSIILHSQ